jgi:hypothetical protein
VELPGPTVWLGGGTGSGKTTVARAFASRHGLRVFPVDSFWYSHAGRLSEADRTPDAQWLGQTPCEQAAEFEAVARARWPLVLADLAAVPSRPPVIVEGPQLLPDLVPQGAAALFLTWENSVFADNVAAWLTSPDAPAEEPGAFSFACECGRRGCAARVDLTLSAYRSVSAVVADGH